MAEFAPFDLGRVLQVSESIKALRRDGENDKLRQAYVGEQIANAQQTRAQQAQTFDTENQQRMARSTYLAAQAVVNSPDPVAAARQLAPEMISMFEKEHGAGSFQSLTPDVVKQIASMGMEKAAAAAGINLQPDPNMRAQQQFTREMDQTNFAQQKQLAGLQHGYRLGEIDASSRVKPGNSFRPLTPEEVAQVGLPAGTSAQVDESTGKVDILSKPNERGGEDKPLPVGALRMVQDARDALSVSGGVEAELRKVDDQIATGKLNLGVFRNWISTGRNATGMSDENSRNFQLMRSTFEKMRNDSLRLNKGVQTEGDAQRAWDELFANLSDEKAVRAQLQRIRRINTRATQLQQENMDAVYENYGRASPSESAPAQQNQQSGQQQQQAPTATGPNGQKLILRNGQWVPLGG